MTICNNLAIIGVGLIGGSIGLAARRRGAAARVVGIGRRAESLQAARELGAVDETTTDLAAGVREADLVVVCTPVGLIVEHVRAAAAACPAGALITDAGSTKGQIVREVGGALARDVHFVGSHPMAGNHKRGPEQAREDLFEDRVVVVTPDDASRDEDVAAIEGFWAALGARAVRMSPGAHDRAAAAVSHLPHAVAAALACAVPAEALPLAAGGLRDTARVAAADPALWQQILLSNRDEVLRCLTDFQRELDALRSAVEAGDADRLQRQLAQAKASRDALGD